MLISCTRFVNSNCVYCECLVPIILLAGPATCHVQCKVGALSYSLRFAGITAGVNGRRNCCQTMFLSACAIIGVAYFSFCAVSIIWAKKKQRRQTNFDYVKIFGKPFNHGLASVFTALTITFLDETQIAES